jgi:hypothetical protein
MKKIIEQEVYFYIDGEEVGGILHSYELLEDYDCRDEYIGHMTISIEGSDYDHFEFCIWGNGESDEEYAMDTDGCYVCVPNTFDEDEEEDTDIIPFSDMIAGF